MPLDSPSLFALPAYEQAYVQETYDQLQPEAIKAYASYFYEHTRPSWQTQMRMYVEGTGTTDPLLPAYEVAYVREHYVYLRGDAEKEYMTYILSRTPWYWQSDMQVIVYLQSPLPLAGWIEAVINDGSTVSAGRRTIVQNFINAEKASGPIGATNWDLTSDYWFFWGENETQALISLKIGRRASPVGAPTFTANRGYGPLNGTSQYINTLFSPLLSGGPMTGDLMRLGCYERTDLSSSSYSVGTFVSTNCNMAIRNRSGVILLNSLSTAFTAASSLGLWVVTRTAGPVFRAFYRGALAQTVVPTTTDTVLPHLPLFIGARNNAGNADLFRASSPGAVVVGRSMPDAQEASQYANIQAFATAVGANV